MYSYLTDFLGTWMYSTLFSGTYWGMYCLRYSTAQQSVTVTSLGMVQTFLSSLYSILLTFLGTLSTLAWSLYSRIFFSKGTYSILLQPLMTSLPVLTVVPTTSLLPTTSVLPQLLPATGTPAPTAYLSSLLSPAQPEPLPQAQEPVVGGADTQAEVVVLTQPTLSPPPTLSPTLSLSQPPLYPMGSPVLPSTS